MFNISNRSKQLTKMPVNSGTMIAHRNGLLCDHAEHSSSQPTVGNAHSAKTGIQARVPAAIVSGLAGPQSSVHGLPPWHSTTMLSMTMKPMLVTSEAITASTGATTTALTDRKSTRLTQSLLRTAYAVSCLKQKTTTDQEPTLLKLVEAYSNYV